MKDPGLAIRTAYFASLNGNLTLNGVNVPVYDRVPNNAVEPFVVVSDQTGTDLSSKGQCFSQDTTILLDIVTRFKSGGGKRDVDLIANQITERIIGQIGYPNASPSFKIFSATLENSNYLESMEDTGYVVRKLLRIRNYVQQLTVNVSFAYADNGYVEENYFV